MPLTSSQKAWVGGGALAAGVLAVGWFIYGRRSPQGAGLPVDFSDRPGPLSHERHEHRKKFRRPDDEFSRENERGEYGGRKHHHHHRRHKHD